MCRSMGLANWTCCTSTDRCGPPMLASPEGRHVTIFQRTLATCYHPAHALIPVLAAIAPGADPMHTSRNRGAQETAGEGSAYHQLTTPRSTAKAGSEAVGASSNRMVRCACRPNCSLACEFKKGGNKFVVRSPGEHGLVSGRVLGPAQARSMAVVGTPRGRVAYLSTTLGVLRTRERKERRRVFSFHNPMDGSIAIQRRSY